MPIIAHVQNLIKLMAIKGKRESLLLLLKPSQHSHMLKISLYILCFRAILKNKLTVIIMLKIMLSKSRLCQITDCIFECTLSETFQ